MIKMTPLFTATDVKTDLLPAINGEDSPRSRGLRPIHGRYSIMIH